MIAYHYKKVERTEPGSANQYKVTYSTGKKKWTNDRPGDGVGDATGRGAKKLMRDPAVKRGAKALVRAAKADKGMKEAVNDLYMHIGKEKTITVIQILKDDGKLSEEKAKEASDMAKARRKGAGVLEELQLARLEIAQAERAAQNRDLAASLVRLAADVEKGEEEVEEEDVLEMPDNRQSYNFDCGANATQTVLAYYGIDTNEGELMKRLKTTREGTNVSEIIRVLKEEGLDVRAGRMSLEQLKEAIDNEWPVILPLQAWADNPKSVDWKTNFKDGHYVTAVGYDEGKMYFEDPATFEKVYLTEEEFLDRWHDEDVDGKVYINYGIVVAGEPEYEDDVAVHMD